MSQNKEELDICPICLDFQNCDSIIMECCEKFIHSYCLSEWLRRRNNCPLCRTQQSSYYERSFNDNSDVLLNFPIPSINISGPQRYEYPSFNWLRDEEIPLLGVSRVRRNAFSIPNHREVNIGISGLNERVQEFYREIEQMENNLVNQLLHPYSRLLNMRNNRNRAEPSLFRSQIFDVPRLPEVYEMGVSYIQNNLGVTFQGEAFNDMGVTSLNIESNEDRNSFNININSDININLNIPDEINENNYSNIISSLLTDVTNQLNDYQDSDDEILDVD